MKSLRFLLLLLTTMPAFAAAPRADQALLERGRYLVGGVGLCADCHSPRNEKGEFVPGQWLMGSAIGFKPVVEMPWAPVAPPIAGLPSMTDEQAVRFLREGVRPDGTHPRPPMPEYRMNEADAVAVVAYLRSLAPVGTPVADRR